MPYAILCPTLGCSTDGTRTKPMTEIFIKNFHDKDAEFPTTNSPPNTNDTLETTILASAQTAPRPTHADTTNKTTNNLTDGHHGHARNYDFSTVTDTDNIRLPPPGHQKLRCHRHYKKQKYLFFNPTSIHFISSQSLRRLINCVPPSSTATTTKYPPSSATLHTSPKTWTSQG